MCDWETYQELEDGSIWSYIYRMENAERYAYDAYCYEGKEQAAWIVRHLVKEIKTRKKWVDIISCSLDEGKFTTYTKVRTIKKYWEPQSAYKETEIVVKVPLPPKDKYIIKAVKEIDDEQAEYIEANRWKLADKIHEEHISPTLDMFNLPPKKENDCNERRNHKHSHRKSQSINVRKRP